MSNSTELTNSQINNLSNLMQTLIKRSDIEDREFGFAAKINNSGKLTHCGITKGSRDRVLIRNCSNGISDLLFHTHPSGNPNPSLQDLVAGCESDAQTTCIGTPEGVQCFDLECKFSSVRVTNVRQIK